MAGVLAGVRVELLRGEVSDVGQVSIESVAAALVDRHAVGASRLGVRPVDAAEDTVVRHPK
ncbi:hypothetical protein [Micromonospora sp. WP24]|uniref:hypothetical protein n=1 Tax=Micromonospora sp. WP24 TaxID=2604469 RepID=UPI0011DC9A28|nr:hypothetical protein [Micromonospora sp. WP24]